MGYTWLNPPEGLYTREEYLEMHQYWAHSISADRNELRAPVNPFNKNFFGDKKVSKVGNMIKLEALHEKRSG
jgi:hypothetical protein